MRTTKKTGIIPVASRLIREREEEAAQRIHRMKLTTMKPSVDNKAPQKYLHVTQNRKRAQIEEERLCEIERQNGLLLDRLSTIANKAGPLEQRTRACGSLLKGEACDLHSLNETARRHETQRIAVENLAILRRIQDAQEKPSKEINKDQLGKTWKETEKYRRLASQAKSQERIAP